MYFILNFTNDTGICRTTKFDNSTYLFELPQTIITDLLFGMLVVVFMDKFHQYSRLSTFKMYSGYILSIKFEFG